MHVITGINFLLTACGLSVVSARKTISLKVVQRLQDSCVFVMAGSFTPANTSQSGSLHAAPKGSRGLCRTDLNLRLSQVPFLGSPDSAGWRWDHSSLGTYCSPLTLCGFEEVPGTLWAPKWPQRGNGAILCSIDLGWDDKTAKRGWMPSTEA